MTKDKYADKRYLLTRNILELEKQVDEFDDLKRKYERSLEAFYETFQTLSHRQEELLDDGRIERQQHNVKDWENHQELKQKMSQHIDHCYTKLENIQKRFKRANEDKREQLIEERNKLPWD